MQKNSPIKEKILQYIDYKGFTKYKFYQDSGITRGVLDKESGISEDNIAKFIAYAKDVDLNWLFLDKGEMIKTKDENSVTVSNSDINGDKNGDKPKVKKMLPFESEILSISEPQSEYGKVIRKLKFAEGIEITDHGAPFYDLPVSAGKVHELIDMPEHPTGYINMPGVNCNAFFPITGASFEPYIRAGDIIGINFIDKWENLDPDCIYLIITYDQRMLKRLMNHPTDSTLLLCISPNLKEFPIDKFTIRYIHKVTFCGRPI